MCERMPRETCKMEALCQARHIDKVLDIAELEGSVPRML